MSTPDSPAALALAARLTTLFAVRAIERHREYPSEGSLPYTTGATEKISMPYSPTRYRASESLRHVLLCCYISKRTGAIFGR